MMLKLYHLFLKCRESFDHHSFNWRKTNLFQKLLFAVSFYHLHKINMSRVSVLWAVLDRNTVVFNRDKSLYHQSTLSSSSQAAAWGLMSSYFDNRTSNNYFQNLVTYRHIDKKKNSATLCVHKEYLETQNFKRICVCMWQNSVTAPQQQQDKTSKSAFPQLHDKYSYQFVGSQPW